MMTTPVVLCLRLAFLFYVAHGATITITNKCTETIWPATLTGDNKPQLSPTGLELAPQASQSWDVPSQWSGRFWARTRCSNDNGKFSCGTGDCGTGQVECNGNSGATPATLAEFTIAANGGQDFYDVSNVDGFNVRLSVAPQGGSGTCKTSSCPNDINASCPDDLKVPGPDGSVIACKSACVKYNEPQYCCTGDHDKPETCPATSYSEFFKQQCPDAYSYAYDDNKSTFTCSGSPNYAITFCP